MITLDTRIGSPDRVLPMLGKPSEIWSRVILGCYQQDHPLILTADTGCRIIGWATDAGGRRLLYHNCTGTKGVSGAPLLIERDGKWYIVGVDVAAELGVASGFAVVLDQAHGHH